jgi:hypothetical protein
MWKKVFIGRVIWVLLKWNVSKNPKKSKCYYCWKIELRLIQLLAKLISVLKMKTPDSLLNLIDAVFLDKKIIKTKKSWRKTNNNKNSSKIKPYHRSSWLRESFEINRNRHLQCIKISGICVDVALGQALDRCLQENLFQLICIQTSPNYMQIIIQTKLLFTKLNKKLNFLHFLFLFWSFRDVHHVVPIRRGSWGSASQWSFSQRTLSDFFESLIEFCYFSAN